MSKSNWMAVLIACLLPWSVMSMDASKLSSPSYYNQEVTISVINKTPYFVNLDRYIRNAISVNPALTFNPLQNKSFSAQPISSKTASADFYYYNSADAYSMCHFITTVFPDGLITAVAESVGQLNCTARLVGENYVELAIWPSINFVVN